MRSSFVAALLIGFVTALFMGVLIAMSVFWHWPWRHVWVPLLGSLLFGFGVVRLLVLPARSGPRIVMGFFSGNLLGVGAGQLLSLAAFGHLRPWLLVVCVLFGLGGIAGISVSLTMSDEMPND